MNMFSNNEACLTRAWLGFWIAIAVGVWLTLIVTTVSVFAQNRGRNQVPCWYTPNGAAITIQCANGFWSTTMPDGTVVEGNGMTDPNATLRGSSIPLDSNGGINISRGQVTPPTQVAPVPAPGQSNLYGLPRTEE